MSYENERKHFSDVSAFYFVEDYFFNLANYNIELGNKIRMAYFTFATLREN